MSKLINTLVLPVFMIVILLTDSGAVSAEQAGAGVKIAKPKPFTVTAPDKLGVNENGKGLKVGSLVKDYTINDINDKPYAISQTWREKPALIVFYRGGWCPFCNMQVRELSENYAKLSAAGVQTVLISADEPDKSAMISAEYNIPFPVLSDPDLLVHKAFNVVLTLDAATVEKYKGYGINLRDWSGKDHNSFAVASAFLIDRQGRVLVSHAPEDYRSRPSTEQLLNLIKQHVKTQ